MDKEETALSLDNARLRAELAQAWVVVDAARQIAKIAIDQHNSEVVLIDTGTIRALATKIDACGKGRGVACEEPIR